jgi:hypothetical protein
MMDAGRSPHNLEEAAMSPTVLRSTAIILLLLLVTLVSPGTAQDKPAVGVVTGKVIFKDQPVPAGTIGLHPEKGKPFTSTIQVDGTYEVKNVPVGKYRVTIDTLPAKPKKDAPKKDDDKVVRINPSFADPKTTPLVIEVVEGSQTCDWNLR